MKIVSIVVFALALLAIPTRAEDYICKDSAGCTARINEGNGVEEVAFRKGDMVSTEDGWVVSPNEGWEKVRTDGKGSNEGTGKRCWCGLIHRCKWCGQYHSTASPSGRHTPTTAHLPPSIAVVGWNQWPPNPLPSRMYVVWPIPAGR